MPFNCARARASLTIPSASRLQVSCAAPRPRTLVVSSATFMPRFCRYPAPGPAAEGPRIPPAPCRAGLLGAKHLQPTLGKGPVFHLNPQGYFPPEVKVGPGLGLGVAHLVVGLEQQRRRQQAGRHTVPAVVGTVELGEIRVSEQPAPRCVLRRHPGGQVDPSGFRAWSTLPERSARQRPSPTVQAPPSPRPPAIALAARSEAAQGLPISPNRGEPASHRPEFIMFLNTSCPG